MPGVLYDQQAERAAQRDALLACTPAPRGRWIAAVMRLSCDNSYVRFTFDTKRVVYWTVYGPWVEILLERCAATTLVGSPELIAALENAE